jgi:hypothetical protein
MVDHMSVPENGQHISVAWPTMMSLFVSVRANGKEIGTATAFPIQGEKSAYLVTNRHVVTGRDQNTDDLLGPCRPDELVVLHHSRKNFGAEWLEVRHPLYNEEYDPLWIEHPTFGAMADMAALRLQVPQDGHSYTIGAQSPAEKFVVGLTDTVSVIGFPFGEAAWRKFPIWATGFVASDMDFDYADKPVFLIDCRSRKGQSGSPVFAYRPAGQAAVMADGTPCIGSPAMRFLGLYSGRINPDSDIGMVWKASAIQELISQ